MPAVNIRLEFPLLSRTLCHMLRHAPEKYSLHLDREGWTDIASIMMALKQSRTEWAELGESDLLEVLTWASNTRFEVREGMIRASYGHSFSQRIVSPASEPPQFLYHGTDRIAAMRIEADGLFPMGRQYVLLTTDVHYARAARGRKEGKPYMARIAAKQAWAAGVYFYHAVDHVWMADRVPPAFIEIMRPGRKQSR